MAPEQTSPYWDRIVGENWPQTPPSAWHGLADNAREGADALNPIDVAKARRAFEETVQQSEGLAEIRRALVALEQNPRAAATALRAAADTFDTIGDVVRRTRNQILDVVGNAAERIEQATRGDNTGDGEEGDAAEAEADRRATEAILSDAQGDVRDIVAAALNSMGPQGLPRLDDIAEALGQPGPWRKGGGVPGVAPRRPGAPGRPGRHDGVPRHHGPGFEPGPWVPGHDRPVRPDPVLGQILIDLIDGLLHPETAPTVLGPPPDLDVQPPVGVEDSPPVLTEPAGQIDTTGAAPGVTNPESAGPGVPQPGQQVQNTTPPAEAGEAGAETGVDTAAVDESPESSESTESSESSESTGSESPSTEAGSGSDESARPDREISAHDGADTPEAWAFGKQAGAHVTSESEAENAPPGAVPPVAPAAMGPVSGTTTAAAVPGAGTAAAASGPAVSGPASTPAAVTSAQAGRSAVGPIETQRGSGATGKALASASQSGVTATPVGKQPVPVPDGDPGAGKSRGPGDSVQDAVGAAMIAASAPAFVVGERVDGDLVLARTLLGGIRAATDSWVVGVDWAVAILRHSSGVSAFVTSNEGRGWLPARLYLPTEVSLPWLWAVSEGSGWEGTADPARILVEFAIAWGAKSGAKLSALASSQPMDPVLAGRLGTVALAGSVAASDTMDLRRPAPGTLDRLGVTSSPRLLDRATKVGDRDIAVRCLELAVDAHIRVQRAELAPVDTMEAPEIRLRILRALRDGRDFADSWWEELQDVDDLIAATALGHRADTSRIGLGELRSGAADLDPGSDLSILRALTFQRRCNELVLLLLEEKSRQTVRDSVYTHAQVLGHPLFAAPPAAPPAPRRSTVTTGVRR
ncbi:hypothetical protein [Nocardia sienata]|uniref:hypothetical protein n=1 Tax=Nocardia sienata TaxID=248552 RepID=UPI0007A42DF1|nr:hypothetical protein [Nocardia sienata]